MRPTRCFLINNCISIRWLSWGPGDKFFRRRNLPLGLSPDFGVSNSNSDARCGVVSPHALGRLLYPPLAFTSALDQALELWFTANVRKYRCLLYTSDAADER